MKRVVFILALGLAAPVFSAFPLYESLKADCKEVLGHLSFGIYSYPRLVLNALEKHRMKNAPPPGLQGGGGEEGGYPDREESTKSKNSPMDNPPSDKLPVVLVRAELSDLTLFKVTAYQHLDPLLGKSFGRGPTRELGIRSASKHAVPMTVYPQGKAMGPVYVPQGYEVVRTGDETVQLSVDSVDNVDFSQSDGKPFKLWIEETRERVLSPEDRKIFTTVPHIPLERFPDWLANGIRKIKAEHLASPLPTMIIKKRIEDLIDKEMLYRRDPNGDLGVLEMTHSGAMQCTGSGDVLVYFLRSEFKTPARIVRGMIGHSDKTDPDSTVVVIPSIGHAWAEVYDDNSRRWELGDATPSEEDKKTKDEEKNKDNRFSPNADSQGRRKESEDAENGEMPSKGEKSPSKPKPPQYPMPVRTKSSIEMSHADAAILHAAWVDTLEGLSNSRKIYERNRLFKDLVKKMRARYPKSGIPYQYSRLSDGLAEFMAENGLPHRSMQSLVDEVSEEYDATERLAIEKLLYIERLMNHLESARKLSDGEKEIRTALKGIRDARHSTQQAIEVPLDIPDGPGGDWFKEKYTRANGDLDWEKIEQDTQRGSTRLESFLAAWRAAKAMNLAKIAQSRPTERVQLKGRGGAFFSDHPDFVTAVDLDQPDRIVRSSFPPSMDAVLLATEELQQMDFPDEVIVKGSKGETRPKHEETYLLQDMSLSMDDAAKWRARNALVLAYLNNQKRGVPHHVTSIPYGQVPREPVNLGSNIEDSFRFLLDQPYTFEKVGNNATLAFQKAFSHLGNGQDVKRVNFLWLTDGEETIRVAEINAMRVALPANTEVRILAINIGAKKPEMEEVALSSIRAGNAARTKVVYVHIDYDQVAHIVSGKSPLDEARAAQKEGLQNKFVQKKVETSNALYKLRAAVDTVEDASYQEAALDPLRGLSGQELGKDILPTDFAFPADIPLERRPSSLNHYLNILAQGQGISRALLEQRLTVSDLARMKAWVQ